MEGRQQYLRERGVSGTSSKRSRVDNAVVREIKREEGVFFLRDSVMKEQSNNQDYKFEHASLITSLLSCLTLFCCGNAQTRPNQVNLSRIRGELLTLTLTLSQALLRSAVPLFQPNRRTIIVLGIKYQQLLFLKLDYIAN